jgi:hypothetical protein
MIGHYIKKGADSVGAIFAKSSEGIKESLRKMPYKKEDDFKNAFDEEV